VTTAKVMAKISYSQVLTKDSLNSKEILIIIHRSGILAPSNTVQFSRKEFKVQRPVIVIMTLIENFLT
jgi:hypothetical protein